MKIPLVPSLLREGRRPLSVEELPWPAAAPPRVPPDGTTGAHSDSGDSRRRPPGPLSDPPLCDPRQTPSSRFPFLLTLPSDFYGGRR